MRSNNFIPVVDLFAGPGGLGEGFSSLPSDPFRIIVSAEMDPHAHKTLLLRAFYRALRTQGGDALSSYYDFCNEGTPFPDNGQTRSAWQKAKTEALQLTLGEADDNRKIDTTIKENELGAENPWVLIGGPPCQAYSLVGRSRNRGNSDYRPEEDHRHFLYKEYLRIIQKYRPAVFVMENVKGILSSSVAGERMFHSILKDLVAPDRMVGIKRSRLGYRIHSLAHETWFDKYSEISHIDPREFIVRAEEYGIPQARHRVILLGVREDFGPDEVRPLVRRGNKAPSVKDVLAELPELRSRLSRQADSNVEWVRVVQSQFRELARGARRRGLDQWVAAFDACAGQVRSSLSTGELRFPKTYREQDPASALRLWYEDVNLDVWLNHEARGHMEADLMRYGYAAAFARLESRSPKGHDEFDLLEKLRPLHANWETGKFSDRFRVQLWDTPSTTITSHISKDGHYFIHPDPLQCRSLTVREAARLQTFPDNYFFQGNRTQQYHQVGNAVPPLLAHQIAHAVERIIQGARRKQQARASSARGA
jgi:DNA (cytosine-5)-methyltransferase 1